MERNVALSIANDLMVKIREATFRIPRNELTISRAIIFGSLAQGKQVVGDIDVMIFTSGPRWPKTVLPYRWKSHRSIVPFMYSALEIPMTEIVPFMEVVDVHILHDDFFTDPEYRWSCIKVQPDLLFYSNVFNGKIMVYQKGHFVPAYFSRLDHKWIYVH